MPTRTCKFLALIMITMITLVVAGCNGPNPPTVGCRPLDLINAIVFANSDKDHDHIILPDNCTYELGHTLFEVPDDGGYVFDLEYAGLPSITSPITITGNNSRLFRPNTPGTADFRIFHVALGGSLSLVELSLENGSVQNYGGAILVTGGTVSINQSEFLNNSAEFGGAIATYELYTWNGNKSEVYIINSVFRNNTAGGGGAIYHNAGLLDIDFESLFEYNQALNASGGAIVSRGDSLTIYNSTIRNNQADELGGGIYSFFSTTTLQGVLIENNTARKGGGLHAYSGNLIIRDCQIRNNQAELSGGLNLYLPNVSISDGTVIEGNIALENAGGIGLDQNPTVIIEDSLIINNQSGEEGGGIGATGGTFHPTVTLNNSTVSGNSAAILGGGVYINSGEWQIHNSTISGNTAAEGGGIYNGGTLQVTNSTISGNQADQGGGVLHTASSLANFSFVTVAENTAVSGGGLEVDRSWIYITNSIVSDNSPQNCLGNIQPFNTNLDDDGSCGFAIMDDPLLDPLGDYGGPTFTHAIAAFSPAVEEADPCTIMNATSSLESDQRGEPRPEGADCDLGAYEANISLMMAPPMPACIYEATKNSHCRESDFNKAPVVEILMQGETAALIALNPENTYGKFALQSSEQCWIALNLMSATEPEGDCPVSVENPPQIPELDDSKKPKPVCKSSLSKDQCIKSGGIWVGGVTEAPHCSCP